VKPRYTPPPETIQNVFGPPVEAGQLARRVKVYAPFIRTIPLAWALIAARLPGKASVVGQAIWYIAGLNRNLVGVSVPTHVIEAFGLRRTAWYNGLRSLAAAHLLIFEQLPGRKAKISLLEAPSASSSNSGDSDFQ
jgi:hypothetical protein